MSLTSVLPYFRDRLDSLGFEEHTDGFDFQNIPETIINKSYHLEVGVIVGNGQNQTALDSAYPVTVRLYFSGFRDPTGAIDDSILEGQRVICEVVKPSNANGVEIKDVQFLSMEPQPKGILNDNIVLLEMNFNARVILETE